MTSDGAPPRPRWFRPRNIALTIVLGLVATVVYLVVWAFTAKSNPTVDYAQEMVALSTASQPLGENAWPALVQAGSLCKGVMDQWSNGSDAGAHGSSIDFT